MKTKNGKRMRKRALGMLLACAMLFSYMDLPALAAELDVKTQATAPDDGETVAETPEGENDAGETGEGSADEDADKKGEAESDKPDADEGNGLETGRDEKGESVSENSVSDNSVSENSVSDNSVSENSVSENSMVTITSSNALGRYFAETVSGTASAEDKNTGCDVYEVIWNGREAAVAFRTTERSTLIVGIYEEDSGRLAASGSVDVSPKDTEAVVSIGTDNIPEYFVLRAFLVEAESARPLGRVYETEDYTRKMQAFYAKTTADFVSDQVLNLDEDTYNNFLVFSQDVTVIRKTENADINKVVVCDEDNRSYKIENPDEQIMSLKAGDIIAYYYSENALIITKIYSITMDTEDGKTVAVILGEDADFASVIEFIKVGAENPAVNARGAYAAYADSVEVSKEWGIDDWSKDDGGGVSVNLKDIGGESTIRVFLDSREKIEKTELEISYGATASVECKIDGEKRWELGNPTMPTNVPGVMLSCKIEVKLAAEVIGGYTGSLSGSVGVAIDKGGVRNISRTPEFVLSESVEASVSLGLVFSPMIKFLHEDILSAALEVGGGVKVTAKTETRIITIVSERHACEKCFAIGIGPYVNLTGKLTFFWDTEDIEILEKDWTVKSCYYSVDHREFGWDECPYKEYKTTVVVKTLSDELVPGAKVNDEAITNKRGIATIWLPGGDHIVYASHNGKSGSKRVIADSAKSVNVILGMYAGLKDTVAQICLGSFDTSAAVTKDGRLYTWGSNVLGSLGTGETDGKSISVPTKVLEHVKTVSYRAASDARTGAAITDGGELYTWGQNDHGALGVGSTAKTVPVPGKILSNVKSVRFGYFNGAAVTTDGRLYLWGLNNVGQLGTSGSHSSPVRILEEETIKEVSLGTDGNFGYSAAVTRDGKLYLWGYNGNGELGNGKQGTTAVYSPERVLENEIIDKVCLSQGQGYCAAVTKGGQLYMWGYNGFGQLGNGTQEIRKEPVKVLEGIRIKEVELGASNSCHQSAAIAEDGSLYLWGKNTYGQLGTGDTDNRTEPFKLDQLGKVKTVRLGNDHTAAITEGGELYTWGRNDRGQLGNGSTKDSYTPVKILDDVISVEVQDTYMAAVTVDGSLWMWGANLNGQLGNGEKSTKSVTSPIRVKFPADTGTAAQSISEGYTVEGEPFLSYAEETYLYDEEALASKEAAYVYVTMRTASYPENFPAITVDADHPAKQTAVFSGLKPQETYNVYVMKDRDFVQRFSNDNLLYIMQAVSGADGNLSVTYEMREACAQPDVFCVGMSRTDLSAAKISVPDILYDGEEHVAEAEVLCNGRTLIAGSDYELCGDVLVSEIGEYKVIVRGIGTYCGEREAVFRVKEDGGGDPDQPEPIYGDVLPEDVPIDGKIPEGLWIAGIAEDGYNYTGTAIKPAVRVYDYKTLLKEKTDYTIAYKNNTKAFEVRENATDAELKMAPAITVTGKGNYTGKDTQTFSIHALDIGAGTEENLFEADDLSVMSGKKAQKPVPVLWWNGKKLKNKTDYTYTYHQGAYAGTDTAALDSVKDAGDYYIKITGKGNFTGELRVKLTLLAADSAAGGPALKPAGKLTVVKIPGQDYLTQAVDGRVTPKLTVRDGKTTLTEGTHYTVSYSNNAKPGTAYAIVKGVENGGFSGTKRVSFTIKGVSIKKAVVKGMPKNLAYNGKEQEPALTLTVKLNGVETTLVRDTDYTLKWINNRRAGTATATFTGKNAYSGTLKKTVKIKAFDIRENQGGCFQAALKSDTVPYAKGGAKPELTVTFQKSDQTTETLKEGTDFTVSYQNNKALHDGSNTAKMPTVIIKGKGNYTGTYAQTLTYQITQQSLDNLTISAADKVYQNKKNIFSTKVKVLDVDGKALTAGRDYDKKLKYAYKNDITLDNGTVRAAGTEVDKNDIIPAGTVITVTALALAPSGKTPAYTGSCTGEYSFRTYDIAKAKVTIPAQTYTGKAVTLNKTDEKQLLVKVNGKRVEPDQFEIVPGSYTNNVKKGTASVTLRGMDNYGGTKKVSFRIKAKGFLWWWRK